MPKIPVKQAPVSPVDRKEENRHVEWPGHAKFNSELKGSILKSK